MAQLRSEVLPLSVPLFLCVAAWAMLVALPAARAHHTPTPRPRVTLPPHTHRPPSPAPAARTATAPVAPPLAQPAPTADTPAAASESPIANIELETISIEGFNGDFDFGDSDYGYDAYSNHAWQRWAYYYRREWQARRRAWLDARARRVSSSLAPGAAGSFADEAPASPLCEVFPAACGASARRAAHTPAASADTTVATVRRDGLRWTLTNGLVDATIEPSRLCAIALTRHTDSAPDALPPLSIDTPDEVPCTVSETMAPDTHASHGGAAVAIVWTGNGWTQRAVLSLADGATSPEVSVSRTRDVSGARTTTLTNLTATELTWTLNGREVRVPVGHAAIVRGA